ncbi:hypothetical protein I7I53_05444 [Histoplasma capsulatum var. duboisii H88]|uniref:Uncharacterized protein n=1 Tax=Ajellomyces capsulatus (strain H88) TaxID=544711 RepID=A0A8A1LWW8_AJEC8|nr:hypothetical protein I7I53_05444 [Histoplasma capsulatum var. duboisii H88]
MSKETVYPNICHIVSSLTRFYMYSPVSVWSYGNFPIFKCLGSRSCNVINREDHAVTRSLSTADVKMLHPCKLHRSPSQLSMILLRPSGSQYD